VNISVFGLGYVGIVATACLLRDGHNVKCIDPIESKVNDLIAGHSPITEPFVEEMIAAGVQDGRLKGSTDASFGCTDCDIAFICVGTPSTLEGGIDLSYVKQCFSEIGKSIRNNNHRPLLVLRSTVLPGTCRDVVVPILESTSGLKVGEKIKLIFHPEFLREGKAVYDFDNPPKIVVGSADPDANRQLLKLYPEKYNAPRFALNFEEAELVKYSDNLYHAVKITFANEVASLAHVVGVDSRIVSEVFRADHKLNVSEAYLKPGFAFGGSCLPKDLRAILRFASKHNIDVPMLSNTLVSNETQIHELVKRILSKKKYKIGMVGLAFKEDTDDMRESPYVRVAKNLIGEGRSIKIYDPGIDPKLLIGANKNLVKSALGHLENYLVDTFCALEDCDLIILNHSTVNNNQVAQWLSQGIEIIDLASSLDPTPSNPLYSGISW